MTKKQQKAALRKAAPRWFVDSRHAEKLLKALATHEGFSHILEGRDLVVKRKKIARARANCIMAACGLATLEDKITNLMRIRQALGRLHFGRPVRKNDRWIHREQLKMNHLLKVVPS